VQPSADLFESRLPLADFAGKVPTNRVYACFPLRQFPDQVHNLGFENRLDPFLKLIVDRSLLGPVGAGWTTIWATSYL
jgi:hypothetical protein